MHLLHDAQGRLVSFKNAIIIMTSNLGSAEMYREHSAAVARRKQQQQQQQQHSSPESLEVVDREKMKEVVMEQVRQAVWFGGGGGVGAGCGGGGGGGGVVCV